MRPAENRRRRLLCSEIAARDPRRNPGLSLFAEDGGLATKNSLVLSYTVKMEEHIIVAAIFSLFRNCSSSEAPRLFNTIVTNDFRHPLLAALGFG